MFEELTVDARCVAWTVCSVCSKWAITDVAIKPVQPVTSTRGDDEGIVGEMFGKWRYADRMDGRLM